MTHNDRSRGELPPAENYQATPAEPDRIGWPETIGLVIFLMLWFAVAIML